MNEATRRLLNFAEWARDGGLLHGDETEIERTRELATAFLAVRGQLATVEAERDRVLDALESATGSNPHVRLRFLEALAATQERTGKDGE